MKDQRAELEWRDGAVPVSTRFDDPYYSLDHGLAETWHVFLDGNRLSERLCDGFHVAELGFGTGLNFLATLTLWRAAGCKGRFRYTSFEAYPMGEGDMETALSAFPELDGTDELLAWWRGDTTAFPEVELAVIDGDARETLKTWNGRADAWFLDGFSPAKNPELWEPTLMAAVGEHTAPNGTFATYTAAGFVRRALEEAGFDVERVPGFGRKRHMTIGAKR